MTRRVLVALLAGLLLLAACDDNGADQEDADGDDVGGEVDEDAPEGDAPDEDAADGGQGPEPVELEDGVASTIDDEEITDGEVEEAAEELSQRPQVAAQVEQGQLPEELLPTLALEQVIQTRVLELGAADLGVEADADDIETAEEELVEDVGGREVLEEQLDQAGLSDEQFQETLRLQVLIDGIQGELDVDEEAAEGEDAPPGPDGQPVDPGELAVQEWLFERLTESDIAVDEQYGVWVAEQGAVMPPEDLLPEPPPTDGGEGPEDPES